MMLNTISSYAFFAVLCIHICAVLQKDPSKFHMSLELARVLLDHGMDMEAQDMTINALHDYIDLPLPHIILTEAREMRSIRAHLSGQVVHYTE